MEKKWVKLTIKIRGADPDEAAGVLGLETGVPVMITEDGPEGAVLQIWLRRDDASPDYLSSLPRSLEKAMSGLKVAEMTAVDEEDKDWLAEWRRSLKPLPLGEKIVIVPEGFKNHGFAQRIPIYMNPGMAFGSGHHATTAGCVMLMEKCPAQSALDVGCGSGILAMAAAKLGAEKVFGVDNDPEAVIVAQNNINNNGMGEKVTIADGGPESAPGEYDLVIANLFLTTLMNITGELAVKVNKNGVLILSGLRLGQEEKVISKYENAGFELIRRHDDSGWVSLFYLKK